MSETPRTDKRIAELSAEIRETHDDTFAEIEAWNWGRKLERELEQTLDALRYIEEAGFKDNMTNHLAHVASKVIERVIK